MKNNKIITRIITMLLSFVLLIPNTVPVLAEEVVPEETVEMRGGEEIESFDIAYPLQEQAVVVDYNKNTFEVYSVYVNGEKWEKDVDYKTGYTVCTPAGVTFPDSFVHNEDGTVRFMVTIIAKKKPYSGRISIYYQPETGEYIQNGGNDGHIYPDDPNPTPDDNGDQNKSDDGTQSETDTSDTQTTKTSSMNLKLNGTDNMIVVATTYDNTAEYTGKSVTGKTLNATTDITSLESATGTSGVFKIKYKGKRKGVGEGSFYPQITYNKNKIDKNLKNAGWSKKQIKVIKKAVKVLNKGLKNNVCIFKVTPVDLSTSEVTVKAKLNKDGTPKIKNGKLQGVKSVKVKSAGGKTFTLGQKQCKISVDGETVTVTGKGKTFTGSNTATVTG